MLKKHYNTGFHIDDIVAQTTCKKHGAEQGSPCWDLWVASSERYVPLVCGERVARAGFNGKITPSSLSRDQGGRKNHKAKAHTK